MTLAALLTFGSAYVHSMFARPVVLGRLASDTAPETRAGLSAAWILGSVAMATFGVLALATLGALGRERSASRVPLVAGLFFLGYGGWAYAYRHHPHFMGFMAIGVLFLAGAFFSAKDRVQH